VLQPEHMAENNIKNLLKDSILQATGFEFFTRSEISQLIKLLWKP